MTKTFKKYRKRSKVHGLPPDIRAEVDEMLSDINVKYSDICKWLAEEGYPISHSAIGRYALESKQLAARLIETQARVQELMKVARKQPDDGALTKGALQIAAGKLAERIALIEEELDDLPPELVIDLMVKLSRTEAYKTKIYAALRNEYEQAYERFKASVYTELEANYPEIAERLVEIANETLGKVGEGN